VTASSKEKQIAVRLVIHGFVQGVNYRRWLQQQARDREITGWTRNCSNGTVEAFLQGMPREVDDLVRACRHGPSMARVDSVHTEPADCGKPLDDFSIEATV